MLHLQQQLAEVLPPLEPRLQLKLKQNQEQSPRLRPKQKAKSSPKLQLVTVNRQGRMARASAKCLQTSRQGRTQVRRRMRLMVIASWKSPGAHKHRNKMTSRRRKRVGSARKVQLRAHWLKIKMYVHRPRARPKIWIHAVPPPKHVHTAARSLARTPMSAIGDGPPERNGSRRDVRERVPVGHRCKTQQRKLLASHRSPTLLPGALIKV